MRTMRLIMCAAVLAPVGAGCSWVKENLRGGDAAVGGGPLDRRPADDFITYLNTRAGRLQSLRYEEVRLRVSGKAVPVPVVNLVGELACAQPKNFRMTGNGRAIAVKVDLGSNPDQFWMYMQAPGTPPTYVFATHTDFESGRAKLPEDVPFDPDWILQALGMLQYPPALPYTVEPNPRDRTYVLRWPTTSPSGKAIQKEVVFDADAAVGTRPQVKRHVMRDGRGKVLAVAEVKAARTVQLNNDPRQAVQYPTHVVLRWEEPQRFEMDLTLDQAQVNGLTDTQARQLFTRRDYPNAPAVNLAQYNEFR